MNQAAGSSELLSFRAPWRRLSCGTSSTGVPEEDDVLHELDDDHRDGDGAQAISAYAKFQCAAVLTLLKFYLWNYGYSQTVHTVVLRSMAS